MRGPYHNWNDVLRSPWAQVAPTARPAQTDRVLRSSKLEDSIYSSLRDGDDALAQIEQSASE